MIKEKAKQYKVGDKVKVPSQKQDGVIRGIDDMPGEGDLNIYAVELKDGRTRHVAAKDLK